MEHAPLGVRHWDPKKGARRPKRERIGLELKARDRGKRKLEISEEAISTVMLKERSCLEPELDQRPDHLAIAGVTDGDRKKRCDLFRHDGRRNAKPCEQRLECAGQPRRQLTKVARGQYEAEKRALADAQNEPLVTDVEKVGVPVSELARGLLALLRQASTSDTGRAFECTAA
jgi:hypothetical protein